MYTIGEFSKITHVSARMLRHYDALGLIHPCSIGKGNGYRYYDIQQLETILTIQEFQSYGVSLKKIPDVLSMPQDKQMNYLNSKLIQLQQEQKQLHTRIQRLQIKIHQSEENTMNKQNVIVLENQAQTVYGIKRTIAINQKSIQKLFQELYQTLKEEGIQRTGTAQLVYLGNEFNYDSMEVEAQVQVAEGTKGSHTMPACQCISLLHNGPHEELEKAYEEASHFLIEHPNYHLVGPVIERFIVDDHENNHFQTGLLFPTVQY